MLSDSTSLKSNSHASGLWAQFQSPLDQSPRIEQFSKAIRTPRSFAFFASGPKNSPNAFIDSGMGLSMIRPVNAPTISHPKRWAFSTASTNPAREDSYVG